MSNSGTDLPEPELLSWTPKLGVRVLPAVVEGVWVGLWISFTISRLERLRTVMIANVRLALVVSLLSFIVWSLVVLHSYYLIGILM